MSTFSETRSYHHGDLRQALIRAALELLPEVGPAELSLRGVARRAGVSAMAPYRHFADKEALLAAVAEYGFRRLTDRMIDAIETAADPRAGLVAQNLAYFRFARAEPCLFKLMFGATINKKSEYPALEAACNAAFGSLQRTVANTEIFTGARDQADLVLAAWSLIHGFSALAVDGRLAGHEDDSFEAAAERISRLLVDGMAKLGKAEPREAAKREQASSRNTKNSASRTKKD